MREHTGWLGSVNYLRRSEWELCLLSDLCGILDRLQGGWQSV